jgi:hypothetical protein
MFHEYEALLKVIVPGGRVGVIEEGAVVEDDD